MLGCSNFQGTSGCLQAEVIFLGQLSHPNLVKLIGYCCEEEHRVLIYEFMAQGSVEAKLFSSNYCYLNLQFGATNSYILLDTVQFAI